MYIDELLRNKTYFVLDTMKGSSVATSIKNLEQELQLSDEEKIISIENKWEALKSEICAYVPYYKNHNAVNFKDFPIINKQALADSVEDFMSIKYKENEIVKVRTSGSYGTPLDFILTKSKKKKQLAEVIYYGRKNKYDVGIRHGYFRSYAHKTKLKFWIQNETFFASKILNHDFVERGLSCLKNKKIKTLIGFPTAILYLAEAAIKKGYRDKDFYVTGIITSSENLTKYQREVISKAFGCEVHSRYSTEELGVLGNEFSSDSGFEMNTANYIIEVLDLDSDKMANIGEVGRIVVTDLNSYAMPLIRYETGDLGVIGEFLCPQRGWVKNISQLSGRGVQILYSTKGEPLYPLYLDVIMDTYYCFSKYQLLQYSVDEFTLRLVKNESFNHALFDIKLFESKFYKWLGEDSKLTIEFVDDIERLPSGKRPYVINYFK